ncbi:MAG TPA: phosphoribosylamine--glycine ligase [Bacteroidales bacterium]|nr:phosphoribosylamine--glycine ligase [Bacteroidales bacterium]HOU95490.1 phosphoribosylamine--glycine ligase [Bacteroidales bacterium]HQG36255.1 phosphoribosylamine--glycine ligase [Bacteroidales bacterium]HQG52253.1 phosphoribosylamine--glycine ligase [Bacteroidales bacterium]HQJ19889.1 phosphoribosylamine--glycine ligase [Bacteroidales bacterium]
MKILILGSGGREHAIAWKLAQSPKVSQLYIAPGNAGTSTCGINIDIDPENFDDVKETVLSTGTEMVVVGPEAPLVAGIHDFFLNDEQLKQVPVIGPQKSGAVLEGSKDFAKAFMKKYGIPTGDYRTFDIQNAGEARAFLESLQPPYVLKADGLAAGKGVIILNSIDEALGELDAMLKGKFGDAGKKVIIEQFMRGVEVSVFIVTDGKNYRLLPEAKDYKRAGKNDTGPNTGGMGSVSPVPFANNLFMYKVEKRIIKPTLEGLEKEGIKYKGVIFFGLISVDGEPYVIEYNVRLGDPEAQAILPRIKSDFVDLLEGIVKEDIIRQKICIDERFVATIVLASEGYPGKYEKGMPIYGLDLVSDCIIFHAGTKKQDGKIVTNGGRVLALCAYGQTLYEALQTAYKNAALVSWNGIYYRTEIGFDLL